MRSTFNVLKKLSTGALSQALAFLLMDIVTLSSAARARYWPLVYWADSTGRRNTRLSNKF